MRWHDPRRRATLAALLVTLAATGGCGVLDWDGQDSERERLEEHRARWRDLGIDSYQFVLRRLCFCGGGTSPATVVVRDGQRVSVTDVATGAPIPAEFVQYYLTIDELFDFIGDAIDRNAYRITVTYDPANGIPTRISIDYDANAIDEEMGFEASAFLPER